MVERSPSKLEKFIYGLDDQKKHLEKLLLEFKKCKKGGSCLLSGRKNSGKTLLLESLITEYFDADCNIRVVRIDGRDFETFAAKSKLFEQLGLQRELEIEENNTEKVRKTAGTKSDTNKSAASPNSEASTSKIEPILFVVDHFEKLALKLHQNVLYSILNGSQTYPWFIILVGTKENSVNLLEKRVRSRLSKLKINFNIQPSFDEFIAGFEKFLELSTVPRPDYANYEKVLKNMYLRHTGFYYPKMLVLLMERFNERQKELGPSKLFTFCFEAILPANEKLRILESLSIRQLCLLNCLIKMEEEKRCIEFIYQEIARTYIKFSNEFDKSLRVHNFVLFKDLDEMISLGVLSLIKGSDFGQLQFRKVTLDVEPESVAKCMRSRKEKIPTMIDSWFNQ